LAGAAASLKLRETVLAGAHRALGARMVEFAGYTMPLRYPAGIIAEHEWTRTHAGLFDVSHMGPAYLTLKDRSGDPETDHAAVAAIVEQLVPGDIRGLKPGQVRYTVLLNDAGGILDDLMIARPPEPGRSGALYVVVNAGAKEADFGRLRQAAGGRADLQRSDDGALIALQGPEADRILGEFLPDAPALGFMTLASIPWGGRKLVVSRSGYTGEDGFELLAEPAVAAALWTRLLADERVRPAGLGARDSLRLEAGLPLYGHDIDETTSPVEAGLAFTVAKRRRESADFPGARRILAELRDGPRRKRVGLRPDGRAPVREGADIRDPAGRPIGRVTSGGFGPTEDGPVAMGYVAAAMSEPGTPVLVSVRGRDLPARVSALPFVPHRYRRKPAS
jgi:aminomethyltransferase